MRKTVFISGSEPIILEKLNSLGYDTLICEENPLLDSAICTHADCHLFTPDGITYFAENNNYHKIVNYLTRGEEQKENDRRDNIIVIKKNIMSPYPADVHLNVKCFGKYILCNTATVAPEIKLFAQNNSYRLIHCNQGYVACSTVKLNDNSAITDDESIFNALQSIGVDCIKVSKGSVKLNGFDYGFIGGCCGMIEKNKLIFFGSIERHTDCKMIKSFLAKHNIEYKNLFDSDLIDIGGLIPLYKL